MLCSIVVPAYNEEKRIEKTLEIYTKYFDRRKINYEIVVVCDGCQDQTTTIVKKLSRKNKRIKLIEKGKRLGKGGGVYCGFSNCKGDVIGFTDADNSIGPNEYEKLLRELKNYDCTIASRRVKGSKTIIPGEKLLWVFTMKIASRIFNFLVNLMFGIKIKDTQCGAKVMKRVVYDKIKNSLKLSGFEFDVELLWLVKKNGFSIKEVGVVWCHNLESKSSIKNSFKMFRSLLKRRLND